MDRSGLCINCFPDRRQMTFEITAQQQAEEQSGIIVKQSPRRESFRWVGHQRVSQDGIGLGELFGCSCISVSHNHLKGPILEQIQFKQVVDARSQIALQAYRVGCFRGKHRTAQGSLVKNDILPLGKKQLRHPSIQLLHILSGFTCQCKCIIFKPPIGQHLDVKQCLHRCGLKRAG